MKNVVVTLDDRKITFILVSQTILLTDFPYSPSRTGAVRCHPNTLSLNPSSWRRARTFPVSGKFFRQPLTSCPCGTCMYMTSCSVSKYGHIHLYFCHNDRYTWAVSEDGSYECPLENAAESAMFSTPHP